MTPPAAIHGLHHAAWRCSDSERTRAFYEDLLGLPLVHAVELQARQTGRPVQALHSFFQLGDGSALAFFEVPGMAFVFKPQHDFDLHVALAVDADALEPMRRRALAAGVEVRGISDHGFIRSLYLRDPDGYVVELAAPVGPPVADGAAARRALDRWQAAKRGTLADLHGPVHKALRLLMLRALQALGRADADDAAELNAALALFDALRVLAAAHMKHECRVVHTAIEARRPGGAIASTQAHGELLDLLAALQDEAAALRAAPAGQRRPLAQRLYRRLAQWVGTKLLHMAHEEQHDAALLRSLYGADELAEIAGRLQAGVEPSVRSGLQAWMLQALNPQEREAQGLGDA